jgi:hypothetical protein
VKALGEGIGDWLLEWELRDVHELARAIVFPAVIAAYDIAAPDPAFGQFGRPVAAAVLQGRRFAGGIDKDDDVLPKMRKGLGPSSSLASGKVAYQKLRRTDWLVLSTGAFLGETRRRTLQPETQEARRAGPRDLASRQAIGVREPA